MRIWLTTAAIVGLFVLAGRAAEEPPTHRFTGQVVDAEGRPVADATMRGIYTERVAGHVEFNAKTDAQGRVDLDIDAMPAEVYARAADGRSAGVARINSAQTEANLQIGPLAEARGRVFDGQKPAAGRSVFYHFMIPVSLKLPTGRYGNIFELCGEGTVETDAEGRYKLPDLVPGQMYEVCVAVDATGSQKRFNSIRPLKAESLDLGDSNVPHPVHELTVAEKIARHSEARADLAEQIAQAQTDCRGEFLRVALIVGHPTQAITQCLTDLSVLDNDTTDALYNFRLVRVSLEDQAATEVLRQKYDLETADPGRLTFIVLDEDGSVLDRLSLMPADKTREFQTLVDDWIKEHRTEEEGVGSTAEYIQLKATQYATEQLFGKEKNQIREFFNKNAAKQPEAQRLLADALQVAARDGKRVLLQDTGTFCGPCWRLTHFIHQHPEMFETNFVYLKIDRWRYGHGQEVMGRYRQTEGGIPWCCVINSSGEKLADWDGLGRNIGCPTEPESIDYFLKVLSQTAPHITEDQIAELRQDLEKKP